MSAMQVRKLVRTNEKVIAGVCGGIARYFDIDPTLVRVLWAVLTVFSFGAMLLIYLICWMMIPKEV